ncbi:MAG: NosD domain-containing protein, partial [Bacteroidales bacterium]|nr:NosD domain-containing protein [Bacteroidales bacterium]
MKKILVLLLSICLLPAANAQTVLPLTDHMEIPSNSNIRIEPGSYDFADMGRDGVIRIMNKENIIIDGTDVEVTGVAFTGFLFNIENSRNITIRNFHKVEKYFYALSAKQSTDIHVLDNNFSYNKKDTSGWISIYTGVGEALGGGVLFDRCTDSEISGNLMTQQNDGVALYECDNITVNDNIVNWNCGFGIRMTTTNNCSIHHNDCSHVNRITDPSDCAAILLITCS